MKNFKLEMENATLADLEQLEIQLTKEVAALQCELEKEKKILCQQSGTSMIRKDKHAFSNTYTMQQKKELCEFSFQATGIKFEHVDKVLLNDKIYKYTANVVTKVIRFYLELTLDFKHYPDYEVNDITCHFMNIKNCFMLEIMPWVQLLTKKKNYSLFMTAIYDYNECHILRTKILERLEKDNYVSYDNCEEENGGITVSIKSPRNENQIYTKCQWSMKFFEETCRIEHNFTIKATEHGMEFTEQNVALFKKFCKIDLKKKELIELWAELCGAIDIFESNKPSNV